MTMQKESGTNRAYMHCLHPEDDHSCEMLYRTLFPPDDESFNSIITFLEFKQLLKTDATTKEGLQYIAHYFGMGDSTDWMEGKNTLEHYFKLLCQIKEIKPKKDCVCISFWERMHQHAALIMALLNAKLSCENMSNGYFYDGDLVFVILKGIYGFKFPKRFLEISSRDLPSSSFLFCQS